MTSDHRWAPDFSPSTYQTDDAELLRPSIIASVAGSAQEYPSNSSTTPQSNGSQDALNQYRMRLPHQLANGLGQVSHSQPANPRSVSGNATTMKSANASNPKAQVRDLVARFDQSRDGEAAYAPRKYSRTASGQSNATTGFRPSGSSSRSPSESRGVAADDIRNEDTHLQTSMKSPVDVTYKPYRGAESFYNDSRNSVDGQLLSNERVQTFTAGGSGIPSTGTSRRPSESLLSVPGNLSSRHRAIPGSSSTSKPPLSGHRKYSSERISPIITNRTYSQEGLYKGGPESNSVSSNFAAVPSASPRSRLPIRTYNSASTSRRGSFTHEQGSHGSEAAPKSPDQASTGIAEISTLAGQRRTANNMSTPPKQTTPSRSTRSGAHATPPSAHSTRLMMSSRANSASGNLLTQLSNAVSPPRLKLNLHDVHSISISEPTTVLRDLEAEDYQFNFVSQSPVASFSSNTNKLQQPNHDISHQKISQTYSQSGQDERGRSDHTSNAASTLDKLMDSRQKSSQLLADVFSTSPAGSTAPVARQANGRDLSQQRTIPVQSVDASTHELDNRLAQVQPVRQTASRRATSPESFRLGAITPSSAALSPGVRSTHSGRLTLDSDSYSVIDRVLDQYHETGVVSPEMVYTFQQHILDTDPDLSARNDIDSLSIAKAALEDLVKDHSQSSLFQVHSQSSFFLDSPANSSPHHSFRPRYESGISTTDHLGIQTTQRRVNGNTEAPMESPTLPGSSFSNNLRFRHYSNANQLVSPTTEPLQRPAVNNRDSQDIGPTPPPKDQVYRVEKQANQMPASQQPMLPEIQATGGGLGFTLNSNDTPPRARKHDGGQPESIQPRSRNVPSSRQSLQQEPFVNTQSSEPPSEGLGMSSSKPSLDLTAPDQSTPATSFEQSTTMTRNSVAGESFNELANSTSTGTSSASDSARLVKRRHIIKELVDTEFSFNQDMKVIEDIYKGTASAVEALTTDDRRILFGNSAQIVEFSEAFLDTLKQAAHSVYVMPRTNKWRIKRGSVSVETNDSADNAASVTNMDGTDEERDRRTFLGEAFGQYLTRMEKVYGDYLRNHDLANQRLARLQDIPQVSLWLHECHTYASDITSAWDLDSLLVKPVQRVLKYPLLLGSLFEATPADHPDYTALEVAVRQMKEISGRINESKKRAELLDQAVNRPNKKKEFDVSSGFSRAFGRRSDKLRQQVGMADAVEDFEYKAIAEKLGGQLFQLQVVMRDMEMYRKSVEEFIRQYSRVTEVIETMIELGPSTVPRTESKWRKFTMTIREMAAIIYVDHDNVIKKHCIEPIISLIKLHEKPQSLMAQRKKRLPEYAKFVMIKNRGERADKKTQQQGDQFVALNDTLKDELPKLYALNAKLVETCLRNYVDIQAQWQLNWQRKISNVFKDQQIPTDFDAIIEAFQNDFAYTESQVLALSVCNGSLLAEASTFHSPTASTLIGTDDASSIKRPSLLASQRSGSIAGTSSPIIPEPDFLKHRSTGSFQMSIHSNRASLDPTGPSPGFNSSQSQLPANNVLSSFPPSTTTNKRRHRSGSASSSLRSPLTPTLPLLTRGSNASGQTIAFGPYQPVERINRPSNPPPASPSRMRSPTTSRFSQNSASSSHASPVISRQNTSTFFNTSPNPAQSPTTSRSSGIFNVQPPAQPLKPSLDSARPELITRPSRPRPAHPATTSVQTATGRQDFPVLFLAASLFEFNIDRSRKESGYPYLTYVPGEIFDVIGEKGELWLAKNQDDGEGLVGWIWEKHFAKLVPDASGNVAGVPGVGSAV